MKFQFNFLKKAKIIVPYNETLYKINLVDGLYVLYHIIWLYQRRGLRFLKRIYLRSLNIVIVIICAVLFSLFIIPLGIIMEKYSNWFDGIWDLRTFILTSILIVFLNTNIMEEKARNSALKNQYSMYIHFVFDTASYIEKLLEEVGYSYNVFYVFLSEHKVDLFQKEFSELYFSEFTLDNYDDLKIKLTSINKEQINYLHNLLNYINTTEKLEFKKDNIRKNIFDAINRIENENLEINSDKNKYQPHHLQKFIKDSLIDNVYIIGDLSRPWRWDHDRNMKIRTILFHNSELVKGTYDPNELWF